MIRESESLEPIRPIFLVPEIAAETMQHVSCQLPPFRARAPWWGGDLQTLRNALVARRVTLPGDSQRLYLPMADGSGDMLAAMLDTPCQGAEELLVVLIHGLGGCEDSAYIRSSAAFHLGRGRRVLRLNLRGAGPSRPISGGQYHAGCGSDVGDALSALEHDMVSKGLMLIGFSLGGNVLINLLAADADRLPIRGAVIVSAPIEPAEAVRRIMAPRNAIYHHWLLRQIKKESSAEGACLTESQRFAIVGARTIREFDDGFVAPRNGFTGADEYYTVTAGARQVPDIGIPTLMISACDDPWIPAAPYEALKRRTPPHIRIVLSPGGGHVGFHAKYHTETWHDRCADVFMASL